MSQGKALPAIYSLNPMSNTDIKWSCLLAGYVHSPAIALRRASHLGEYLNPNGYFFNTINAIPNFWNIA